MPFDRTTTAPSPASTDPALGHDPLGAEGDLRW